VRRPCVGRGPAHRRREGNRPAGRGTLLHYPLADGNQAVLRPARPGQSESNAGVRPDASGDGTGERRAARARLRGVEAAHRRQGTGPRRLRLLHGPVQVRNAAPRRLGAGRGQARADHARTGQHTGSRDVSEGQEQGVALNEQLSSIRVEGFLFLYEVCLPPSFLTGEPCYR